MEQNQTSWNILQEKFTPVQKQLGDKLAIPTIFQFTLARIRDTKNIILGVNNEIQGLRDQVTVVSEKRLQSIFSQIKAGTNIQLKTQKAAERQDSKMQVLQLILSGSLAFQLISFFIGQYSFIEPIGGALAMGQIPFFLLSTLIWFGFSFLIFLVMRHLTHKAEANIFTRITFEEPVNLPKLQEWLEEFEILTSDIEDHEGRTIRTVNFSIVDSSRRGRWHGNTVEVSLSYDMENAFLYSVDMDVNQPTESEKFFKDTLDQLLRERGILRGNSATQNAQTPQ